MCKAILENGKYCKRSSKNGNKYCVKHSTTKYTLNQLLKKLEQERLIGKYRLLKGFEKDMVRGHHIDSVSHIKSNSSVFSTTGIKIANNIDRIVIGDHGPYLEFNKLECPLKVAKGQEFRLHNNIVKYIWYEGPNKEKIYKQIKTVKYADYKIGKFYIDPKEVQLI